MVLSKTAIWAGAIGFVAGYFVANEQFTREQIAALLADLRAGR